MAASPLQQVRALIAMANAVASGSTEVMIGNERRRYPSVDHVRRLLAAMEQSATATIRVRTKDRAGLGQVFDENVALAARHIRAGVVELAPDPAAARSIAPPRRSYLGITPGSWWRKRA